LSFFFGQWFSRCWGLEKIESRKSQCQSPYNTLPPQKELDDQDLFFCCFSLKLCSAWMALKLPRVQNGQLKIVLLQKAKHALEKLTLYRENTVS
jgi:hypothetical protein